MTEQSGQISRTGLRKTVLRDILLKRDFKLLLNWAAETRNPIRTLISFQFGDDPLIAMRAVEALGRVAELYRDEPEIPRRTLRRLFWMMNDESGNVGWYAAEAIGEILRNSPKLIPEYAHTLPSFLAEEPFEKGVRIAIARVAQIDKSPFDGQARKELIRSLDDARPEIRGASLIALLALADEDASPRVKMLLDDRFEIDVYNFSSGMIDRIKIKDLAEYF